MVFAAALNTIAIISAHIILFIGFAVIYDATAHPSKEL